MFLRYIRDARHFTKNYYLTHNQNENGTTASVLEKFIHSNEVERRSGGNKKRFGCQITRTLDSHHFYSFSIQCGRRAEKKHENNNTESERERAKNIW